MSKYLFKIFENGLKTIQYNPIMRSQNVTLRQLIAFQPENDRERGGKNYMILIMIL